MKLEMVTLALNNPEQVRRTLASVALQSVALDRHIIVDGSSDQFSPDIRKFAEKAGAEYFWREPKGIYPAMNEALQEVSSDSYVWFLNSSDWLASPESLATVRAQLKPDFDWAVGGLHRYRDNKVPMHPTPRNSEAFVGALCSGRIGFPHPSAILSTAAINRVGAFDESYRIAGDYALALRFTREFGAPQIISEVISIHDPTGLTSRYRALHVFEKSRARREFGAAFSAEVSSLWNIIRLLVADSARQPKGQVLDEILPPFSQSKGKLLWPDGCLDILDSWGA